ncbi:MAG: glycosyltransferase family 2 protein, partial [Candidatus Bathyarchaeota archaeon]|nr:glycosyltransferase family 2 protein [Candidatus Bathyarchaeota archaeon]
YPWLNVIQNKEDLGFTGGSNIGISLSKGDYIAIVNDDVEVDPLWLSELIKIASVNPKIGACGGKFYDLNDKTKVTINHGNRVIKVTTLMGAAILLNHTVISEITAFDPEYFMYFEEIDLFWRIRLTGYSVLYVPSAIAYHPEEGGLLVHSKTWIYLNFKNWIRTVSKNCGIYSLPLYLSLILVKFVIAVIQSISPNSKINILGRAKFYEYYKGLLWNIKNVRNTIYMRKKVQRTRKVSDLNLGIFNLWYSIDYSLTPIEKLF